MLKILKYKPVSRHKLTSSNTATITATQDFSDSLSVRLATIGFVQIRPADNTHLRQTSLISVLKYSEHFEVSVERIDLTSIMV